jgi:hypothetical protein
MAALNRRTVQTDVFKEFQTTFIDINKAVGLITDTAVITELKRLYTSLDEVGADFLTTSEAYGMAQAYFAGGATTLYLVPVTAESSGSLSTIPVNPNDFIAISDGEFDVDVDAVTQAVTALDFTSVTSVADVAAVISAGLTGATCSVGIANALVITSDTTGVTSIIDTIATPFAPSGTDISALIAKDFLTPSDSDIIAKLTELENDSTLGFNFVVVGMDKALGLTNQVTGQSADLAKFVFNKEYQLHIDTSDATAITAVSTDPVSTNKRFYDNLSGSNALRIGNVSYYYTDVATDFVSFGIMGELMAEDIGERTVKFMKPIESEAVSLLNSELTNLLNKNGNVFTGTNERTGRSFVKEGLTLKDGDYIDTSLGSIWLKVQLEENIYNLLESQKVPINQNGFDILKTTVTPVFEQAIAQGIINGLGEGSFKFDGNTAATIISGGFDIDFKAGDVQIREIIGEYVYFDSIAGHFITNTVIVKTEA